jgi:hypothetical protein
MKLENKVLLIFVFLVGVLGLTLLKNRTFINKTEIKTTKHKPNIEFINESEKKVIVTALPKMKFSYDLLKKGVIQHLDRDYTYDYIPKALENGLLYQGIHRPEKGTSLKIELFEPAAIFFFFHSSVDGGYSEIFEGLKDWERLYDTPKYDVNNGGHGLKMTMYKRNADKGIYQIPATVKDKACFNIVFKFQKR